MFVLSSNWFQTLIRQFFFSIDKIVYNFISTIYDLLITIARTSILSQADIIDMADRIYKLLAVFMVFKVTFSLIMYVVNPDDFSDKSKGVAKLGTNIVISLALLILTPYMFSYAYQLQTIILEDNSLATLIFGESDDNFINSAGDTMSYITIMPFFTPNVSIEVSGTSESDGKKGTIIDCVQLMEDNGKVNENCSNALKLLSENNDDTFEKITYQNYIAGLENSSLGLMFRQDMAVATVEDKNKEKVYVMDYKYIFSTIVGVVIILLLITFCMDVALRSIKLAFLQLIAPIPIISYIDPKSGKDGLFKKWYKMCFSTYISLFIRLLAIYFAVYIIGRIDKMVDIVDGSYVSNMYVKIFIIIGVLMFAKQLPKLLENLGIKLDSGGKFFLNPLKKFEEEAFGGKRMTGAAGGLMAGAADRAARIATAPGAKGKLGALLGAGPGLLGAAARGFGDNSGFRGGLNKQAQVNRRLREGRINGLSPMASYLDYAGSIFGLDDATLEKESTLIRRNEDSIRAAETALENKNRANVLAIDNEKKRQTTRKNTKSKFDNVHKQGKRLLDTAEDFTVKKGNFDMGAEHNAKMTALNQKIADAKARGLSQISITDNDGNIVGHQSIDEYYARESRKINEKNYKLNRNADEANVQHLSDHNGEVLTSTFMIGNELFAAGTVIDGNVIARAKDAQGIYIKDSQKAVTNEMYRMSEEYREKEKEIQEKVDNNEDLTQEEQFYFNNMSDFHSFDNINTEFKESIIEANAAVDAYNQEYTGENENIEKINSEIKKLKEKNEAGEDVDTKIDDIFSMIKNVNGNIESGKSITKINTKLAKSESTIEAWERANEINRKNTKVEYVDESGKITKEVSLDEAKSKNKSRDENNKYRVKQHQQRRSLMQNISSGKK